MVLIIGEYGINISKNELWVVGDDFIRRVIKVLMPDDDILDPAMAPGNTRLHAVDSGVMTLYLAVADSIFILFDDAYHHILSYIPHGRHERKMLAFSHGAAA
jgi:hypothetical protein